MKLDLRENMYIRTNCGRIDKIFNIKDDYVKGVSQKDELYAYDIDNIVKASYNIIDLIEVGDYVNGRKVNDIQMKCDNNIKCLITTGYDITNEMIKTIVTHEQMEQMEYKVGD